MGVHALVKLMSRKIRRGCPRCRDPEIPSRYRVTLDQWLCDDCDDATKGAACTPSLSAPTGRLS